ncbi:DUF6480 family protein [Streptomyces sp. NPDC000983]|uniref:DUF6480 family protein n=1 Tax=Streptomyces sp. NPDC000983 TaxID=3154373 RepID=UPI003331E9CD
MSSPDPEPTRTPGVDSGGQVSPEETPPAEGGTFGTHPDPPELRNKGWAAAPLTVILVLVALVAIGLIAMVVAMAL